MQKYKISLLLRNFAHKNGKTMTKALFFDIDGTLVSFRTHEIPASAIEALTAAKAQGIRIFIATGRPNAIINNLSALQDRNLIDGYVTMNGGYCFVGSKVIYKRAMPAADAHAIMDYCTARAIPCVAVGEYDIRVCHPDKVVREIFQDFLKVETLPACPPEKALQGRDIYQMTPFINAEQEQELLPAIPHSEIGRWHPAFVDITAKGNTKQKGMDEIIRYFGIPLEDTVSFGDGGNDIPMLRHAGIGVAMGNAGPEVKAVADYVTDPIDEDGVAKALKALKIIQ